MDLQGQRQKIIDTELGMEKEEESGKYLPNKKDRNIRRHVYDRYRDMFNNQARKDAEAEWEIADKESRMEFPDDPALDADDQRANLHLPDAFSAMQTQQQETIERKSRPYLRKTESTDEPIEEMANAVMNHNMDNSDYDLQFFMAKNSATSRGTAFLKDYWRTDKRVVKYPSKLNEETGEVEYEDKEVIDFDDDFTEWIPNEFIGIDEKALHIMFATDCIEREILHINEFKRIYNQKKDFRNIDLVQRGGDVHVNAVFQLPKDINESDVEVVHYNNKSVDAYWVVANNVVIHDGPMESRHKQLPYSPLFHYRIPGRFWGMGIPKVIHFLSEERRTIRNLNLDRQKMHLNKMFVVNSSFGLDEEETVMRMGGIIELDTGGQPLNQAILPLEYGDVPASYFRTEEVILEDIRRATGIDDRITVSNSATTATQAAIVKESTLKRVNFISILAEMDTVKRIGMLKWSNIQFFYPVPRIEKITQDNKEKTQKTYRTISVKGKKFSIIDDQGAKKLKMDDVKGASAFELKGEFSKHLNHNFDITVDAGAYTPPSKAIQQTKSIEMWGILSKTAPEVMDKTKSVARLLKLHDERPEDWMMGDGRNSGEMMMLAESENLIMAAGQPLAGTEGATEEHTLVHLMYAETQEYQELPEETQQIIKDHILQEHDKNPATGSSADLLAGAEGGMQQPPNTPNIDALGLSADTTQPQVQMADNQPTNFAQPE